MIENLSPPSRPVGPRRVLAALVFAATTGIAAGQAPPATGPQDLKAATEQVQKSEAELARLRSEIAGLKGDRARLNAELLKSTDAVQKAETRVSDSQARLSDISASEAALRRSLEARRETTAEVLATLQRMGRKPPPAVIVRPEDMLEAIRSAILLGYVLPEIRAEAETLVADLSALVRLREAAAAERSRLALERDTIAGERTRLFALIEARQAQIATSEQALQEERQRLDGFARQAQSLKELIARTETDAASLKRAEDQAAKVPVPAKNAQELAALTASAFKDPARLQPRIAFTDARGLLALPTNGPIVKAFGSPDGFGGTERGITIAAAPGNVVTAPADGWILYAGAYRSYGRVLIINAGNGYNFVLTGLRETSVEIGQFVLAGEPLGTMASGSGEAAGGAPASPALYVELRKDNQPIDPGPWWAKNSNEKARG